MTAVMPSCISSQALLTLGNPSLRPSDQDPSVAPEKGRRKTTHANTNDKTKPHKPLRRKLTRPAYTLPQIASLRAKIFSPTFKPPRPGRIPNPPSLAGSRLPPPCAEIDERPRVRRRRFKLWKDNVVELRVAVLNPRKRDQLKRFRPFAVPSTPYLLRGTMGASSWWASSQVSIESGHSGPEARGAGRVQAHVATPPLETGTASIEVPVKSTEAIKSVIPPKVSRPIRRPHQSKAERTANRRRLLQHKFALEQESERRFRLVMDHFLQQIMDFQRANTFPSPTIGPSPAHPAFLSSTDLTDIKEYTNFFRRVRNSSKNVWDFTTGCSTIFDNMKLLHLHPVSGLEEAKKAVETERRMANERKSKRQKRVNAQPGKPAGSENVSRGDIGKRSESKSMKPNPADRSRLSATSEVNMNQVSKPVKTRSGPGKSDEKRTLPPKSEDLPTHPPQGQLQIFTRSLEEQSSTSRVSAKTTIKQDKASKARPPRAPKPISEIIGTPSLLSDSGASILNHQRTTRGTAKKRHTERYGNVRKVTPERIDDGLSAPISASGGMPERERSRRRTDPDTSCEKRKPQHVMDQGKPKSDRTRYKPFDEQERKQEFHAKRVSTSTDPDTSPPKIPKTTNTKDPAREFSVMSAFDTSRMESYGEADQIREMLNQVAPPGLHNPTYPTPEGDTAVASATGAISPSGVVTGPGAKLSQDVVSQLSSLLAQLEAIQLEKTRIKHQLPEQPLTVTRREQHGLGRKSSGTTTESRTTSSMWSRDAQSSITTHHSVTSQQFSDDREEDRSGTAGSSAHGSVWARTSGGSRTGSWLIGDLYRDEDTSFPYSGGSSHSSIRV